jgi:transposase-like protein
MPPHLGIPDMRFINRDVPIAKIAHELDLQLDAPGKIHCWHPERHQHGDRTASVGIRTTNNTVKCFGCDSKPMGPIDLVMDVLGMVPAAAALWIAERFHVPTIPARKRFGEAAQRYRVGYEGVLGLLIRSGLWARLSEATRAIAPVLIEFAEKQEPHHEVLRVRISYGAIARSSGIGSPNAIRKALVELSELGLLEFLDKTPRVALERGPAKYALTPNSDALYELAQTVASQNQQEIAVEVELRARMRRDRRCALKQKETTQMPRGRS